MGTSAQQARVLEAHDIPPSAANLQDVSATTAVAGVTNYYMTNRLTLFEHLVIAITQGYAAGGRVVSSDEDFAKQACNLARAIAYEAPKYGI